LLKFTLSDTFFGPRFEVDSLRELAVIIQLFPLHRIVVIFEALQINDHSVLKAFDVRTSLSIDLAIVLVTEVFVITIQKVRLNVEI